MRRTRPLVLFGRACLLGIPFLFVADYLLAHCDGLDGPVVAAAEAALATGNPNLVLIWVPEKDEPELRSAFQSAMSVRVLTPEAQQLADRYFFETVVRLHRAGEGAPYDGLKPAGRDLGPAIPAADRAVETGNLAALEELLVDAVRDGLHRSFTHLREKREYAPDDVARGREYVQAYVEFVHYVERVHADATHDAAGHYAEEGH